MMNLIQMPADESGNARPEAIRKRSLRMPVQPQVSYPGVYVQELPSGVHTIAGVSTSVTAFVGRTARGPVNQPVTVNSFADFERAFGGLWSASRLGYAVRDFYQNGGKQAVIVRLFGVSSGTPPARVSALLNVNGLPLEASSPGSWGNSLRARVDLNVAKGIAQNYGLQDDDLFNLSVLDTKSGTLEVFRNVSVKPGSQQLDKILANSSSLLRVQDGAGLPASTPPAHLPPGTGKTIWTDDNSSSGVAAGDQASDGGDLSETDFTGPGLQANKQGLYALELVDLFNLLVIPPYKPNGDSIWDVDADLIGQAAAYCEARRAFLLVDPPSTWTNTETAKAGLENNGVGTTSRNAAVFFPGLQQPNPLQNYQVQTFAPSGSVAGLIARIDSQRGVWKAPAGLEASLVGVTKLAVPLTDDENGELNPLGINCLRTFPGAGQVVWGARTLQGDDRLASEWKYIPVRRLALYIEESLYRGTKWAVFEPNDEPLWAQLRLNVGAFMHDLFRQGAFQGQKPQDAYFVRCDSSTTTQNDIDNGRVNILVGFAPLKPAEFVILSIQQIAGQIAV
jgi:phage tail sheath protein FI